MAKKLVEVKNTLSIWKPSVKLDEIEGRVEELKETDYGNQFCINDERMGLIWTPSHKVLQNRMSKVIKGSYVKIVYEGQELPKVIGNNPTSLYRVFVEE